ncbi:expressed unknown protein [Seminavis robusta]|uniref:Uncharacterized protein n=1 Tax=Seminavis robusta TaxID=568900 RepID=A0A9N8DKJ5_9STRA|nr:expressed unknown protein [Seminavis robusta]|eukprot:Sro179_g078400.1 n/a (798) ;mRNA; f:19505-21898
MARSSLPRRLQGKKTTQHRYTTYTLLLLCCALAILLLGGRLVSPAAFSSLGLSYTYHVRTNQTGAGTSDAGLGATNRQLEDLRKQIQDLKTENRHLHEKLDACNSQAPERLGGLTAETVNEREVKPADTYNSNLGKEQLESHVFSKRHHVCGKLSQAVANTAGIETPKDIIIPSTSFVWTQLLAEIHNATNLLPNDPQYQLHDFTAHLLQLVSSRLPHSAQTLPRSWESVQSVLDIAWKRLEYFQLHPEALVHETGQPAKLNDSYEHKEEIPRPVNIIILGGSLLQGTNCRKVIRDLGFNINLPLRECCWGHRLGAFLNQLFQAPLVEVTNIGVGGTNTATGTLLIQFELLPPEAANHPDVIINGYSTNDMHAWTMDEAAHSNLTLADQIRVMVENFHRNATLLRTAQQECHPESEKQQSPPLVVYLDDYLGNEQREILSTMEGSSSVQTLARYYGFTSVSYADVVRDWVYGDTHESWFSPEGWYPKKNSAMVREIHPQLGMHIVAAWVVAYNLLHLTTTYCSLEPWRRVDDGLASAKDDILQHSYDTTRQALPQLPALRGDTQFVPGGKPKPPPNGLPPRLTQELSLDDISRSWQEESSAGTLWEPSDRVCPVPAKCPFAWVSRIRVAPHPHIPDSQHRKEDVANSAYWKGHALSDFGGDSDNSSWAFQSEHGKVGVSPLKGVGSNLLLEIPPPSAPPEEHSPAIRRVTLFYMKSYGPKWDGSTVRLDVMALDALSDEWKPLSSTNFVGYHAKTTSETYADTIDLPPDFSSSKLRLSIKLIKGETFKIMGLAACRS